MDHLPHDIPMLVSAINFLLRDQEFDTLDEICYAYNVDRADLETRLKHAGYTYNELTKKFW
ncbi:MAG: DUF4250 domain-containing protein [Prevotella sp.]|nr:DUF4250 domain-containing protein [Prevotella sp.]MDY4039286.1 DUF4250 domain-containing protein [Prevotella sp.]